MSRGLSIVVPASAVVPERHVDAPVPGTLLGSHNPDCYGCGASHPAGLHLTAYSGEGMTVNAKFTVTEMHQGAPGLAHGGLLSCAFDEALGKLMWLVRQPAGISSITHLRAFVMSLPDVRISLSLPNLKLIHESIDYSFR